MMSTEPYVRGSMRDSRVAAYGEGDLHEVKVAPNSHFIGMVNEKSRTGKEENEKMTEEMSQTSIVAGNRKR
jgi:hypothetical protein